MPAPYAKRRRRAKTLLVAGLVLTILFILSTRFVLGVALGSHRAAYLSAGSLVWHWSISDLSQDISNLSHAGPFFLDRNDEPLALWFNGRSTPVLSDLGFPLTLPIAATLLPGLLLTWRTRHRPGHCPRCDYDLAGLEHPRCPECGTPTQRPA